jgi:hypothetical protein
MIMTANGVELHADIRGEGTPVPLRHGWPDSSARRRNQIPFLAAHRFRTIAPDLRGCAPFGELAKGRWRHPEITTAITGSFTLSRQGNRSGHA